MTHSWSGKNASGARTSAAKSLVNMLVTELKKGAIKDDEAITLIGHSHGGNVNIEAINLMVEMKEFKGRPINLLTINTPVRDDYQLSIKAQGRVNHVNVYDPRDPVQISGGHSSCAENLPTPFLNIPIKQLLGETGLAGRTFSNAKNIAVNSAQGILDLRWIHGYEANSHSGMTYPTLVKGDFHNSHNRVSTWINKTR